MELDFRSVISRTFVVIKKKQEPVFSPFCENSIQFSTEMLFHIILKPKPWILCSPVFFRPCNNKESPSSMAYFSLIQMQLAGKGSLPVQVAKLEFRGSIHLWFRLLLIGLNQQVKSKGAFIDLQLFVLCSHFACLWILERRKHPSPLPQFSCVARKAKGVR
jgi:hypothetical protein